MNNYMSLSPLSITHTMRNSKLKILPKPLIKSKYPGNMGHDPPDVVYDFWPCHKTGIFDLKKGVSLEHYASTPRCFPN